MKFCDHCDNMLYVSVNENKKLVHYCKTCANKVVNESSDSVLVINDNKIDDTIKYAQYLNKHLKHDPTLPRVNNIVCKNETCKQPTNEVIYIKYDHVNMKYLYYCCHCEQFWKST